MKLEFSRQILEKRPNYHVLSKSFQWEPSYPMRMDGRDEANSRFSQLCEKRLKSAVNYCAVFTKYM